jgi:HEAT repeat protein
MTLAPLMFLLAAQPLIRIKQPGPQPAPAATAVALSDEQVLQNAHLDSTGPGLLDFFRKRTTPNVDRERLNILAKQLADKAPAIHTKAIAELIGLGPPAVPTLRRLVNHVDDEATAGRARKCLENIEGRNGSNLVQGAVRLLAARNPEGAADALLTYLPFADDETLVQEIETALLAVGRRDGQPESALVRSLNDPVPVRRSIAARVLCQVGGTAGRAAVHPLLKDPRPTVRMQAALGLADTHDAEAVPVLIDLVADLPPDGRKQVETYLTELAGEWAVKTPQGNDATSGRLRRELWAAWWRGLDGQHLLDEFTSRTLGDEDLRRALDLIDHQLDNASADVRAKAAEKIIEMGPRVAPLLRQAIGRGPARLARSAQQCLEAIERDSSRPLPDAAPRLLALRRPKGTVEALLAYLPFADNETLVEQITELLGSVGCTDGKADPALVRALEDKVSVRRAAAAVALCKGKADEERPAVRKLLRDTDVTVRAKTAIALVERGDKNAMPVLIGLLAELPSDQVWQVEDLLAHLAGDKAPEQRVGGDDASRKASVEAWKKWWSKEEKIIDLAKRGMVARDQGLLLLVEMQGGRVVELSRTGQVRWQIQGVQWAWDAQVCSNGHIVVAHQSGNQVGMYDRQGKELWQRPCNQAIQCQPLRNGHVFVVARNQLFELDAAGKEVASHNFPQHFIVAGRKFSNGQMAFLDQQGNYVRLDATGKQLKSFQVPFQWQNGVQGADLLPDDRVVVSLGIGKVAEYAAGGKLVWETAVVNAGPPHRLANGHTLLTRINQTTLLELDRTGKIVAEKNDLNYRPYRVHRR